MPTYLYETVPSTAGEPAEQFELRQGFGEAVGPLPHLLESRGTLFAEARFTALDPLVEGFARTPHQRMLARS